MPGRRGIALHGLASITNASLDGIAWPRSHWHCMALWALASIALQSLEPLPTGPLQGHPELVNQNGSICGAMQQPDLNQQPYLLC